MARKEVWLDDISGEPADETLDFGLDGRSYEIDLSEDNAKKLRACLADFVTAAEKKVTNSHDVEGPTRAQMIRAWAQKTGRKVNDRGRIPAEIEKEYDRTH